MGNINQNVHRRVRFISLGVIFTLCIAVFAVRLIYYQVVASDKYATEVIADGGGETRTLTVQAQRGNICDRNGNVLVKNGYTYDLQIEYGALPEDRSRAYATYLDVIKLLQDTNTEMTEDLSPFIGRYPDYEWSDEAKDPESKIHKKLLSALKYYYVETKKYPNAETAFANVDAKRLGQYIAQNYGIVTVKKDGTVVNNYDENDTNTLILLRYNMVAKEFGIYNPYVLATDIDTRLISAAKERHLTGVTVKANAYRVYNYQKPSGDRYMSHILGTVGSITEENGEYYTSLGYRLDAKVGRSGCELAFEKYLHGEDGTLAVVEDTHGNVIKTYWVKEPIPGKDVWLTIDILAQLAAEDSLEEKIRANGGVGGAVAATDPNTGAVIALASLSDGEINRAISAYEPGSTFKVGMALAALNEGIITEDTVIATHGVYKNMACSHNSGGYCCGDINVVEALERSCNYFFGQLGDDLASDKIKYYASLYGFGQPTGIEIGLNSISSEPVGKIYDENNDLSYMSAIGQLNQCTPLQISQYISMIANGGTRYSAHLLSCVKEYGSNMTVDRYEKKVAATLSSAAVKDEYIDSVRRGMLAVVYGDSASSYVKDAFKDANYQAAGKTGTAEREGQKDNAFFVAFAPYDAPMITVTCFIEQGYTGGLASGIARDVMDAYIRDMDIKG